MRQLHGSIRQNVVGTILVLAMSVPLFFLARVAYADLQVDYCHSAMLSDVPWCQNVPGYPTGWNPGITYTTGTCCVAQDCQDQFGWLHGAVCTGGFDYATNGFMACWVNRYGPASSSCCGTYY
jgi:hypothetical protein